MCHRLFFNHIFIGEFMRSWALNILVMACLFTIASSFFYNVNIKYPPFWSLTHSVTCSPVSSPQICHSGNGPWKFTIVTDLWLRKVKRPISSTRGSIIWGPSTDNSSSSPLHTFTRSPGTTLSTTKWPSAAPQPGHNLWTSGHNSSHLPWVPVLQWGRYRSALENDSPRFIFDSIPIPKYIRTRIRSF